MNLLCSLANLIFLPQNDVKIQKGTQNDPVLWLDRLSAILRHTSPLIENASAVHPCLNVISEVFPVLSKALEKYQNNLRIMERCCRCLRFAIRCVGKQAGHLLEPLVKQVGFRRNAFFNSVQRLEFVSDDNSVHCAQTQLFLVPGQHFSGRICRRNWLCAGSARNASVLCWPCF